MSEGPRPRLPSSVDLVDKIRGIFRRLVGVFRQNMNLVKCQSLRFRVSPGRRATGCRLPLGRSVGPDEEVEWVLETQVDG